MTKTMKRNMKKHGCSTEEEYRKIRKERKKKEKQIQRDKHSLAKANRKTKSATKVSAPKKK